MKTLVVGPFQCNCSIIACTETKEAIIVDAGDEFPKIRRELEAQGLSVKLSVHTHAHLDHIGAAGDLKKFSPETQIALHHDDEFIYKMLPEQGRLFGLEYEAPPAVDRFLEDEETVQFGGARFSVLHTPGHSPGGICLCFAGGQLAVEPVLFTGDTLFRGSVGRTDLWGGDPRLLIKSIKERILTLDGQTRVYPGHGLGSSVGLEKRENPFL